MAHLVFRLHLILLLCTHFGYPTSFLPMVVWDHLNPQLSCKCNWLVIPRIHLYDRLEFVCPTLKIAFKQVDGYSRPQQDMNENIFRRQWDGTLEDFWNSIRSGTIHSFCNPSSNDTTKIHVCKNGAYDSTAVTFKYDMDKRKHYKVDQIYVFYNNGDDGKKHTLRSRKVKCSMLFAVYVSNEEKLEHDITYGKTAFTSRCDCNHSLTCKSSTTATLSPTNLEQKITKQPLPKRSSPKRLPTEDLSLKSTNLPASKTTKPLLNCKNTNPAVENPGVKCESDWLTIELFIGITITALVAGILGTVGYVEVRRQRREKVELVQRKSARLLSRSAKEIKMNSV